MKANKEASKFKEFILQQLKLPTGSFVYTRQCSLNSMFVLFGKLAPIGKPM